MPSIPYYLNILLVCLYKFRGFARHSQIPDDVRRSSWVPVVVLLLIRVLHVHITILLQLCPDLKLKIHYFEYNYNVTRHRWRQSVKQFYANLVDRGPLARRIKCLGQCRVGLLHRIFGGEARNAAFRFIENRGCFLQVFI